MITPDRFIQWMNVVRSYQNDTQYRILESFWESQIKSKVWLIETLNNLNIPVSDSVYIFGGWFGVLGGLLLDYYDNITVHSVDVDSHVKTIGIQLNPDVNFITSDMKNFTYLTIPNLVINTSTEHITQDTYTQWYNNLPTNTPIVIQGNNFFSCNEHIRCSNNIHEFNQENPLDVIIHSSSLDCKTFTRFMTIGYKI